MICPLIALVLGQSTKPNRFPDDCPAQFMVNKLIPKGPNLITPIPKGNLGWPPNARRVFTWSNESKSFEVLDRNTGKPPTDAPASANLIGPVVIDGQDYFEMSYGAKRFAIEKDWTPWKYRWVYGRDSEKTPWVKCAEYSIGYARPWGAGNSVHLPPVRLMNGGTIAEPDFFGKYTVLLYTGTQQNDWYWGRSALGAQHLHDKWKHNKLVHVVVLFTGDKETAYKSVARTFSDEAAYFRSVFAQEARHFGRSTTPTVDVALGSIDQLANSIHLQPQPMTIILGPDAKIVGFGHYQGLKAEDPDMIFTGVDKVLQELKLKP